MLYFVLNPPRDPEDFTTVIQDYNGNIALPVLWLYPEGLFADPGYLTEYLASAAASVPPAGDTVSG